MDTNEKRSFLISAMSKSKFPSSIEPKENIMHRLLGSSYWALGMVALVIVTTPGGGCTNQKRCLLLKEYGPSVASPPGRPLNGITICIKKFACAPTFTKPDQSIKPEQLPEFTFSKFTTDQAALWSKECKDFKKRTSEAQWREIGNLRGGFGNILGHVYALNDPGTWLAETLKMDLESQGAKVVDISQSDTADVCLSGLVQSCWLDKYMAIGSHLVVDLELQSKNHGTTRVLLHAAGGTGTAISSTSDFYKVLRESRQKLSWLVTREIQKTIEK
jgi:hypothetical protein